MYSIEFVSSLFNIKLCNTNVYNIITYIASTPLCTFGVRLSIDNEVGTKCDNFSRRSKSEFNSYILIISYRIIHCMYSSLYNYNITYKYLKCLMLTQDIEVDVGE